MPISERARLQRVEAGKARVEHGGAAAEKALTAGREFSGLAKDAEQAVDTEIANNGIEGVYIKRAKRLQAASDLYWDAILSVTDMERIDRYMQRWAWLQGSALRALAEARKIEKESGHDAIDVTTIMRGDDDTD